MDSLEAYRRGSRARQATELLAQATAAVREDEARLLHTSRLVVAAELAGQDAGLQVRVEMSPERGAAHRAYLDRPDVERGPCRDPLENVPAFLRA